MLSPVLVMLINPLCPLGKCYHCSALHGSWDAGQVLGALPGRALVPTGCRYRWVLVTFLVTGMGWLMVSSLHWG